MLSTCFRRKILKEHWQWSTWITDDKIVKTKFYDNIDCSWVAEEMTSVSMSEW